MLEIFSSFQIKCKISSSTNRKCQNRRESMTQLLLLRFILVGPTLQAGEPPQSFDIDNTSLSHNSINNAPIDTVFFLHIANFLICSNKLSNRTYNRQKVPKSAINRWRYFFWGVHWFNVAGEPPESFDKLSDCWKIKHLGAWWEEGQG